MTADQILEAAAQTFKARNAVYKDNCVTVGKVIEAFRNGKPVTLSTADDYELWHIFELIIVKLTRFVNSDMKHEDSIHDAAVYCAMLESIIIKQKIKEEEV